MWETNALLSNCMMPLKRASSGSSPMPWRKGTSGSAVMRRAISSYLVLRRLFLSRILCSPISFHYTLKGKKHKNDRKKTYFPLAPLCFVLKNYVLSTSWSSAFKSPKWLLKKVRVAGSPARVIGSFSPGWQASSFARNSSGVWLLAYSHFAAHTGQRAILL